MASMAGAAQIEPACRVTFDRPTDAALEQGARLEPGKLGLALVCAQPGAAARVPLPRGALGHRGALCFWFRSEKRLGHIEPGAKAVALTLVKAEGLQAGLRRLRWGVAPGLKVGPAQRRPAATQICFLKANVWYHMAYCWDGPRGETSFFLNGVRQCVPRGSRVFESFGSTPTEMTVGSPGCAFDDLRIYSVPLDEAGLRPLVAGRTVPFDGEGMMPGDVPFDSRKIRKTLIYEDTFDRPDALANWRFEGPGRAWIQDGKMLMTSHKPSSGAHIVNWNKRDFPKSLLCEWDFRRTVNSGLTIVFFCAKGVNGDDIFAPSIAPRTGVFRQYILGDINSYHISYYACGRASTNMRKNSAFYLTAIGKDRVTPEPVDKWHRITILKHGNKVRLAVNGVLCLAFDDDGKTYKPVWGEGKIGLRQMAHTHTGMYDNFRVYRIVE